MNDVLDLMKRASRLMTEVDRAQVSVKGRSDFVTDRDVAVQEFMREGLTALYPAYGFLSEEQENDPDFSKPTWILDPIDGTSNFISHYRQSAISLGLLEEGEIVFGAIYNPFTDELFTAERGKGAFCNGTPIHADGESTLPQVLIDLGSMPYYKDRAREIGRLASEILLRASDFRRIGSAALALCCVAAGRTGAFIEGILQPWDFAAGVLIAREAGAKVTTWEEEDLKFDRPQSMIAAAPQIYGEVLTLIRDCR